MAEERLLRLRHKFRSQREFAAGYSPLYARIFGTIAVWLEVEPTADPLVAWLLEVAADRQTLDVTLLLAAGLHYQVLDGDAPELADFFSTTGGVRSHQDAEFEPILRQTILAHGESLAAFIRSTQVQTNETGRGLCWLLPLLATGWERVHLVDLGASAGLNLVADRRAYRLVDGSGGSVLADIGRGQPVQFTTYCRGDVVPLQGLGTRRLPGILSRTGGDLAPFALNNEMDELALMSFVWGDQVDRLQRLREGIDACRDVATSPAPVRLLPVDLPDQLGRFLEEHVPAEPTGPVVIYNTYMKPYLRDKGDSMGDHINRWARGQDRPVMWVQWEVLRGGPEAPEFGWCGWTVDLWDLSSHRAWLLGWVHPHGGQGEFGPGLGEWLSASHS